MRDKNWMRRYTLKCGPEGQTGFEIGHTNSATETALHISFSIEKSDSSNPNDAKVQVWNLSDENLKILEMKDCIVELRAGYEDSMALILVGNVTSVITTIENADRMTEITVVDGNIALRDVAVSISMNGMVNCRTLYNMLAKEMGMPITYASDLTFKNMPNGFSYVGKARLALHKVATFCRHKWSIQNQVIQITNPGRAIQSKGFLLANETGLIGIPRRVKIDIGGVEQFGYEVEFFLNGAIGINETVVLRSSTANGYFRVQKLSIDGDNIDGDWICTAQVIGVGANAELDSKV